MTKDRVEVTNHESPEGAEMVTRGIQPLPVLGAHVDFVKNDWFNRRQERIGIVRVRDGATWVEQRRGGVDETVLSGLPSLEAVREKFGDGDYFFTSEIHDESACPWLDRDVIPMISVPIDGSLPAEGAETRESAPETD